MKHVADILSTDGNAFIVGGKGEPVIATNSSDLNSNGQSATDFDTAVDNDADIHRYRFHD